MMRFTLLLCCCIFAGSRANRVYVHPFSLFAAENVSCETLKTQTTKPFHTIAVAPLDMTVLTPDNRDTSQVDTPRQNITERTAVLAALLNSLGLRIYQALSGKQQSSNTLLSPVNTFGSLVTFYLGASRKTARFYQVFTPHFELLLQLLLHIYFVFLAVEVIAMILMQNTNGVA